MIANDCKKNDYSLIISLPHSSGVLWYYDMRHDNNFAEKVNESNGIYFWLHYKTMKVDYLCGVIDCYVKYRTLDQPMLLESNTCPTYTHRYINSF